MDNKKLNILFNENIDKTSSDDNSSNSGNSHGENVCSRAVKELLDHSLAADAFANILQIKDDQIKNAEDKVTELEIQLNVYKERLDICSLKIKDKDDLIAILSNGPNSVKNVVNNLMELLRKYKHNFQQTVKVDQSNEPIESTIRKLEQTFTELIIDVIEKKNELDDITDPAKRNVRIYGPYGTSKTFMFIPNTCPFQVIVETNDNEKGWIVIQRQLNGKCNFNRNLTEYYEGFGDMPGDFWLGLENIHKITTNQRHVLRIEIIAYSGKKYFAEYDDFVVAGKDDDYKLNSLGKYTGNADDMMRFSEHQRFQICPVLKRGWWDVKDAVQHCNLNGRMTQNTVSNVFEYLYWGLKDWGNSCQNIVGVSMKIIPRSVMV